ncbi:hypothetical protein [Amycolatopsis cihanbeyliensis]|uniref:PPE family protein n=1 Tax=Amycolatopsis cihanbeyliensis TaxID=1128664 RepID=A0A542DNE8_AMYCI|nr:hypothetical protein [Amycolatopsis cihanbeyliensis]TQJ04504.1 hypothetical protein FB471_4302 [Amycolatopsis cihanbeyliensis]
MDGTQGQQPVEQAQPAQPIEQQPVGTEQQPVHGGTAAGSTGGGNAVRLGDNSETSQIVEHARGRQDGFEYGADRAIGSPPNWPGRTSQQLYHAGTVNNRPDTAQSLAHSWTRHGSALDQVATELYTAISELGAAWIGQGAGAAQGTLVAIANSSAQAGEAARVMGDRMQQQAAAAEEVKKMPPAVEHDPGAAMSEKVQQGPAELVKDAKPDDEAAKAVKAEQIRFLEAYTKAMSDVDDSTPSFAPESIGLKPMSPDTGGDVGPVGGFAGPGGLPGHTGAGVPGAAIAGGHVAAAGSVDSSVGSSGYAAGGAPVGGQSLGAGSAMGSAAPAASGSGAPAGAGAGLGAAAVGGGVGFAGARALGQGNRSGSKQQSDRDRSEETGETEASLNQGQGSSAAAIAPQQNQGVVSSGGTIGGGAHPPAAGAPMGGGMGGMRGGQQQQEEEHTHASFLIEPDPDDAFGANEATPPPVIGAWANEAEER